MLVNGDVTVHRDAHIYMSDRLEGLYPDDELYASDELYFEDIGAEEIDNIVAGTMKLDEVLLESELEIGVMCASKFECEVYDTGDMAGKYMNVYFMENGEFVQAFFGIVDSSKLNRNGLSRQVIAYDLGYEIGNKNVASFWQSYWAGRDQISVGELRNAICNYACGDEYSFEMVELPNDNEMLEKPLDFSVLQFRDILRMLCQFSGTIPKFSRYGVLEFIRLNPNAEPLDIEAGEDHDEYYEGENSEFEEYYTAPLTGINFLDENDEIKFSIGQTVWRPNEADEDSEDVYQKNIDAIQRDIDRIDRKIANKETELDSIQEYIDYIKREIDSAEDSAAKDILQRELIQENLRYSQAYEDLNNLKQEKAKLEHDYDFFTTKQAEGGEEQDEAIDFPAEMNNNLIIGDNIFLMYMDYKRLDRIGRVLWNELKDITYKPSNVKMIVSDFDIRLGDRISTKWGTFFVNKKRACPSSLHF